MSRQAIPPIFSPDSRPQTNTLSFDEVRQLTRILARFDVSDAEPHRSLEHANIDGASVRSGFSPLACAKAIYTARQRRTRYFPRMIFGETGWEILLVLYIHDGLTRLCIRDVGQLIDAPATTILRWLKVLEHDNFISVRKHHLDRRVTLLDLTELGRARFTAYLVDKIN